MVLAEHAFAEANLDAVLRTHPLELCSATRDQDAVAGPKAEIARQSDDQPGFRDTPSPRNQRSTGGIIDRGGHPESANESRWPLAGGWRNQWPER
jgi:hypothetical protein